MKRTILLLLAVFGFSSVVRAASPVKLGIKGGLLVNSASLKYNDGSVRYDENSLKLGWETGVFVQVQFPGGFLIQPEVVYTQTRGMFPTDYDEGVEISSKYIDVPVLLGWRFLGLVRVLAGPSFRFPTDEVFNGNGLNTKNFTLGFQAGVGVDLGRFTLDARYCGNLTKITDRKVTVGTITGLKVREQRFAFSVGCKLIK